MGLRGRSDRGRVASNPGGAQGATAHGSLVMAGHTTMARGPGFAWLAGHSCTSPDGAPGRIRTCAFASGGRSDTWPDVPLTCGDPSWAGSGPKTWPRIGRRTAETLARDCFSRSCPQAAVTG